MGFLRATFGGAGDPVALTPPVIERVHWEDWDSSEQQAGIRGLRRQPPVVQKVWLDERSPQPSASSAPRGSLTTPAVLAIRVGHHGGNVVA